MTPPPPNPPECFSALIWPKRWPVHVDLLEAHLPPQQLTPDHPRSSFHTTTPLLRLRLQLPPGVPLWLVRHPDEWSLIPGNSTSFDSTWFDSICYLWFHPAADYHTYTNVWNKSRGMWRWAGPVGPPSWLGPSGASEEGDHNIAHVADVIAWEIFARQTTPVSRSSCSSSSYNTEGFVKRLLCLQCSDRGEEERWRRKRDNLQVGSTCHPVHISISFMSVRQTTLGGSFVLFCKGNGVKYMIL